MITQEECKKMGGHCYGNLTIKSGTHGEYDTKKCKHCGLTLKREWAEDA